ncbi:hypothetical protein TNCV_794751 [Trichonephila clavipes]|nr:hypothetical protein TNCV_794751 [Trichonephila clavipes]
MAYSDFEKAEAFKDTLEVTFQENEEPYCDNKIEEVESLVSMTISTTSQHARPLSLPPPMSEALLKNCRIEKLQAPIKFQT